MGPLYFVSARKLQLFGVRIDSTDEQFNYIIDEDQSIGADGNGTHGPNSVISMLHHCLFRRSFGEKRCVLHADNCGSQNKNRFVIAYLLWRIHQGLNKEIVLLMAIPGHTKCLIDGGFGRIKKLYRRSDCDCLQQFAEVVEKSSTHNYPVLFSKPNGEQEWIWYDWRTYLKRYFRPLNGIQKFHSFRVTAADKTSVFVKERSAAEERKIKLLKSTDDIPIGSYPEQLQPAGLSRERQKYLLQNVRPFVRAPFKDITCPALTDITEE